VDRTYNQYCATARTLDLVGERWTLLLVRDLLTGPKRFGDLQKSLRGMGTGLLAARMKHLEREGLVEKITLPPPARTPAYALTEAGRELGPAVLALAGWGTKWAMGERRDGETFHAGWAVLAMEAYFDAEAAVGVRTVYEFRVGDEVFHVRVADGTVEAAHGPAQLPDATLEMPDDVLVALAEGRSTLAEAIRARTVTVTGDREALRRLRTLFRRPQHVDRQVASQDRG
jgi:DNA-binding HxlR family transcriptional regulator/putative sterol carrier protein